MSDELKGRLNPISQDIRGNLNSTSQDLRGNLNIFTMKTGDGREIELALIDGNICWRRVNDTKWIQLVPLSAIKGDTPQKGIDYWTDEDKKTVFDYINQVVGSFSHQDLAGRDDSDQHPIESISGLRNELENISSFPTIPEGNLLVVGSNSKLNDSGCCVNDIRDKSYIYKQKSASNEWYITHNLNKYPAVSIVDSADSIIVGEVQYIDMNSLIVKFSDPFSGKAYIN